VSTAYHKSLSYHKTIVRCFCN